MARNARPPNVAQILAIVFKKLLLKIGTVVVLHATYIRHYRYAATICDLYATYRYRYIQHGHENLTVEESVEKFVNNIAVEKRWRKP